MQLLMMKEGATLKPMFGGDIRDFSRLKTDSYMVTVKKARNPHFHRLMFAVLNKTIENVPEDSPFANMDAYQLLKAIQFEIGAVEMVRKMSGEMVMVPKSVAFEAMDEIEFNEVADKVINICAGLIGVEPFELMNNCKDSL